MTDSPLNQPDAHSADDARDAGTSSVTDLDAEDAVAGDEDKVAEAVEGDEALPAETLTDADLASDVSDDQH